MVEAGASSAICSALTSYKKAPGTLVLKRDQGLQWTPRPDQSSSGDLIVPASDISSIFASKEGAAKVILKVVTTDPVTHQEASHSFLFTSAASAVSEREMFKRELSDVVASARAAQEGAAAEATKKRDKGKGKAADPIQDPAVRARLLRRDAELGQLFKDLVMTDIIPESEFWEGREHLLLAEALADNQTRGRSGQMVDPRPETSSSGELTMKITPQLIHDIFEQLPIVQRAYNDNVPKPLSEEQFWLRYFQSKLHERNRASARNSDSLMKDDPIFDKYLDLPDDDLEPQNPIDEPIYPLLNLEATSNDHEETGNTRDYTMQAGKQKGSLPLMRRFNEHSQRMLDIALGESDRRAGVIDGGNAGARNYYSDIVLDDLQDTREDDRITLNMEQQAKHFDTLGTQSGKRKLTEDQVEDVFEETRQHYRNWDPDLSQFKPDKSVINETAESLMRNIRTRFQAKETKHSSAFPEGLLREMVSCQAAANEFLRLYWSACLPARPDDISPAASATPAQKAQKAQRMITYLARRCGARQACAPTVGRGNLSSYAASPSQPAAELVHSPPQPHLVRLRKESKEVMISSIVALVVCYGALALAAVTPVLTPGKVFTERGVAAQKWQVNFIGVAVIPYNNVDTNQCNLGGGSGSVASYQITVYADNSIQPTIVRAQPTTTYVNQHGFSAGFWKFEISSAGTLTTNWQCCSCVLVGDFFIPPPGSIAQPIKPNTIVGEQICSPNVGANNVDCKSLGVTKPFSQVTVKSGSQSSISPIDG